MIKIGNTIINAISIGSAGVQKIDWGNDQVWPDTPPQPSVYLIVLDGDSRVVSSGQSDFYINVSASTNSWTVSSDQSWCTVAKDSRTQARCWVTGYNQTLETRDATLSFKIDNVEYDTFVIRQQAAAPYINLNATGTTTGSSSGSGTIRVSTNVSNWGVWITYKDPNTNWITATKSSLTSVTWTVLENQGTSYRQATMTVSGGGVSADFHLVQNAGYIFQFGDGTKNKTAYATSAANQNYQISITSTYEGNALAITPIITYNNMGATMELLTSGSAGYYVYRLAYPQRTSVDTGTFAANFRQEQTNQMIYFNMYQSGAPATLTVYPAGITAQSGITTGTLAITTNASSWKASVSGGSWITLPSSGADYLDYRIAANNLSTYREGYIIITAATAQKSVTVHQYEAYVPSGVDGIIASATSGEWVLGVAAVSTTPVGDVRGIYIACPHAITSDYYAYIGSMEYQNNQGTYTISSQTYQIPAGSTFTASGTTYNGIMVVSPYPNEVINSVSQFGVYPL